MDNHLAKGLAGAAPRSLSGKQSIMKTGGWDPMGKKVVVTAETGRDTANQYDPVFEGIKHTFHIE